MIASQAFCCASLILPHIKPARLNPAGGKLDQRCSCAVSFNVARKAFAAVTIVGVASCDVLAVVGTPSVDVVADGVVASTVAAVVGAVPVAAVATTAAVAAAVAAGALVGSAVG